MEAKLMRSLYFVRHKAEYKGETVTVEVQLEINHEEGKFHISPWRNGYEYFDFENGTVEKFELWRAIAECILEAARIGARELKGESYPAEKQGKEM